MMFDLRAAPVSNALAGWMIGFFGKMRMNSWRYALTSICVSREYRGKSLILPMARFKRMRRERVEEPKKPMLETLAFILIVMWLLGMITSFTMGGFIHILLVIAVVAILVRLIQGRHI